MNGKGWLLRLVTDVEFPNREECIEEVKGVSDAERRLENLRDGMRIDLILLLQLLLFM